MKKILFLSYCILSSTLSPHLLGNTTEDTKPYSIAFSAGYVFKHDHVFKQVYGHGIPNLITVDSCYYPWDLWGIGVKVGFWRAKGHTTFLKQHTLLHQIPLTFYLRRIKDFQCGLQAYASLGGGIVWIKEKSYLGRAHRHKGIGELEVGINYPLWCSTNVTGAFSYLFPHQFQSCKKADVGGFELRAGIEFSF